VRVRVRVRVRVCSHVLAVIGCTSTSPPSMNCKGVRVRVGVRIRVAAQHEQQRG
jgi:hypothetical protein